MHIKQHKSFGGVCIYSVITLARGKLKFWLASPFAFSLLPGPLILSPVNELLEEKVVWGGRKQRERWESRMKRQPSEASLFPSEARGSHTGRKGCFNWNLWSAQGRKSFRWIVFRRRGSLQLAVWAVYVISLGQGRTGTDLAHHLRLHHPQERFLHFLHKYLHIAPSFSS